MVVVDDAHECVPLAIHNPRRHVGSHLHFELVLRRQRSDLMTQKQEVSKSGMFVVYKKWYVCGLQKMVCTWFTKHGMIACGLRELIHVLCV